MHPSTDQSPRTELLNGVPWKAVGVFILTSYCLAWLVALPLWMMDAGSGSYGIMFSLLAQAMMFTPAIAVLVVVFLMKVPGTRRARFLGVWPLRPAKRVVWFMVFATLVPLLIVALITAVAALLHLVDLDLVTFRGFQDMLAAQVANTGSGSTSLPAVEVLVVTQLLSIPFAALLNSFFAFGEEVGWRGWLLPALLPFGTWPALIVSGVVWGLWHSPLVLLGYNFGYTDIRGVLLMTAGSVAWGVLFGWSRLRSGSVWPAVIGHGSLNASGGLVLLLSANAEAVNLSIVGPLGVVSWGVIAAIVVGMVLCGAFVEKPLSTKEARERIQHLLDSVGYRVVTNSIAAGETYDEFYQRLSLLAPTPQTMSFLANAYSVEIGTGTADQLDGSDRTALAQDIVQALSLLNMMRNAGHLDEQYAQMASDIVSLSAALSFTGWEDVQGALGGLDVEHEAVEGVATLVMLNPWRKTQG